MLGGALSPACTRVLLGEHPAAPTSAREAVFSPAQRAIVDAAAERIIPETDTPGARAAGVPAFIELMVGEWYSEEERASFLAGVDESFNQNDPMAYDELGAAVDRVTPEPDQN